MSTNQPTLLATEVVAPNPVDTPNNSIKVQEVVDEKNLVSSVSSVPPTTEPTVIDSKPPTHEQATEANPNVSTRVKLSRSGQRRLGKLLKEGYNREEALVMVLSGKEVQTQKRPRSVEPTPTPSPNPPSQEETVKRPRMENETSWPLTALVKPSKLFGGIMNQRVVAVCSVDYPLNPLSTKQMDITSVMIMKRIIENKKGMVKPSFSGSSYKAGYLSIVCNDGPTKDWIIKTIPTIIPWEGAQLHAVDEKMMSYPLCAVAFIANGAKHETTWIMDLLEGQNYNYNFEAWRLVRRVNRGENSMMVWVIDNISADLLRIENNKMNFCYKALFIKFKPEEQTTVEKLTEEMVLQERR